MTTPTPPVEREPETHGLRLVAVLLGLTMVSGLIDAVSYLGLSRVFTANMTGNVVVLGFAAAGAPGFSVPHTATSLGCFLLGAATAGRAAPRLGVDSRRRVRLALTVEAGLVGVSAVVAFAWPDTNGTRYALIAVTAYALGLRNAAVRTLRVADLTTTVLTMTVTALAAEFRLADATGHRSARRSASVLAMAGGACLGGWLVLHHGPGIPLLLAALVSGVLALLTSGRE
ncbi:YoaK family protein [Streptomyces cinerochromogenes]|uniref:YoaK family protein n=1 Tax=Streptomyces cinerochromogenes TaxID=66422 RepID=A0ABW7B580_9ACTN